MTGYGEASYQSEVLSLAVELRALNNRYLKVSLRAPEPYNLLESEFEKVVRKTIKRGTLQIHLRCQRQSAALRSAIPSSSSRRLASSRRTERRLLVQRRDVKSAVAATGMACAMTERSLRP